MKPSDLKIQVASPCSESWTDMTGDNSVRHCGRCDKSVFNLSALTVAEIEELVRKSGNTICRKYYLRSDGTLLTEDCPVGLRWIRRKVAKVAFAAVSLIAATFSIREPENKISRLAAGVEATRLGKNRFVRRLIDSYRLELHAIVPTTEVLESRFPQVDLAPLVQPNAGESQNRSPGRPGEPHWPEIALQKLRIRDRQLALAAQQSNYPRSWYTVSGW